MAILITGAGLIGCHTARLLAERGERVVLYDACPIPGAIASIVDDPRASVVTGDVTDLDHLARVAEQEGVDRVVHTAALLSNAIRRSPLDGIRVNVMGTANILELARRLAFKRVVLASSTTVHYPAFGDFAGPAFPEDYPMRMLAHRPGSIYAGTKVAAEYFGLLYRDLYALDVVALRYAAVLGGWSGPGTSVPGKLLATLLEAARAGREAVIDDPLLVWEGGDEFVDARDCARANVAALDAREPAQGVYTIGSGALHRFDDFVDAVRAAYPGLRVRLAVTPKGGFAGFPHVRHTPSDISAARRELGWAPSHALADSVRHFFEHMP